MPHQSQPDPADASAGPGRPRARLRRPLVLVGLMGAGKTSVGMALARRLGVRFSDSDHEIELAAGMSVQEIFDRFGEPYFRRGEHRVIDRLLHEQPGVLATGGGAFIQDDTRAAIAAHGVSVWLRADLDLLFDRVKGRPGRPLLATADPRATLARLMEVREPVYARADLVVDARPGDRPELAAERVLAALRARDAGLPPEGRVLAGEN